MTAINLVIRDAQVEEASTVLEIWRAAFDEDDTHGDLDEVQRLILNDHNARLLLAEVDGKMAGTLIATYDCWRGNLYRLAVLPDERKGIARALVSAAEDWLHAVGARRISALVVGQHEWATSFWLTAGYGHEARMRRYVKDLS